MKNCSKCKENKDMSLFSKNKRSKDGLQNQCKMCQSKYKKDWNLANPDWNNAWKLANPEYKKDWKLANPEKIKAWNLANPEYGKVWRLKNPEKINSYQAKRRAKKLQATPKWANTEFEKIKIQSLYELAQQITKETGIRHQVDHIVPLNSNLVQGFHCLANLQILEAKTNRSKGNRFWPDMPE